MALPAGKDTTRKARPLVAGLILLAAVAIAGSAGILVGEHGLKGASLKDVFDLVKGGERDHTLLLPLPGPARRDAVSPGDVKRDIALAKNDRWFAIDEAGPGFAPVAADGPPLKVDIMGFDSISNQGGFAPAGNRP